jgi:hypothetical protein
VIQMHRNKVFPVTAALILGLSACVHQSSASESIFRLTATIQEIMNSEIDPAADFIWGAVGYYSTAAGAEERQPRTDEEWTTVRHNALTMIEATNLLVMEGRRVAAPGSKLDPSELAGVEDPQDIQKAIDANRAAFIALAHGLHDAGMQALAAIDAKDTARLEAAGEKMDQACEQCHRTYWYPNAPEPTKIYNGPP